MSAVEDLLWKWLVKYYSGPQQAASRHLIREVFNMKNGHRLTDREFRMLVASLVTEHKKPICTSSTNGYYVARNWRELNHSVAELRSRVSAINERATALESTIPLEDQQELF